MLRTLDREVAFKVLSALIVIILGTQFALLFVETRQWGWPMVTYPMYSVARYDGERFDEYDVYAVLKDATKVQVDPDELGMGYWIFRKNVIDPLLRDVGYDATRLLRERKESRSRNASLSAADRAKLTKRLAPVIDRYCDQSGGAMTRFEVSDRGVAISAQGPIHLEPKVVAAMDVTCE
jgi:hypothetical protein